MLKLYCNVCTNDKGEPKFISNGLNLPLGAGELAFVDRLPKIAIERQPEGPGIVRKEYHLCPECIEKVKKALGI